MIMQNTDVITPAKVWPYRFAAAFLILGAALLRIAYLIWLCPFDLSPDEAHYWDWSRNLDWSYYSKGPLVAWLIRLSCTLFGPWSIQVTGTEMVAVRLPAVVCGSLLLVSLYVLTVQVFRREGLALAVVGLALTLPLLAAGSSLMTIDAPFTCCWGWALVFGYRAVFDGRIRWWLLAGFLVGLGILAKFTMVLWIPSLGLFLLTQRTYRPWLLRRGWWLFLAVAAAGCLPIVWWNAQHDWVTLRHAGGHAGFQRPPTGPYWLGPPTYLGLQFLVLLGYWFVVWLCALIAYRPGKETAPAVSYLWWMSAPLFGFFLLFSFKNGGGEPNWPVAAYIAGLLLAAHWLADQVLSPQRWYRQVCWTCIAGISLVGLSLTVLIHFTPRLQPVLSALAGPASPERPCPLRRVDPTCRLRGWRTLAAEIDRLRTDLRAQGSEPVLAAAAWTVPGELAFYCQGHPQVYSLGPALGERYSQYDLWRPNPLSHPEHFTGKTFIIVGNGASVPRAFGSLDPVRVVTYTAKGQPIAQWWIIVGHDFRGFVPSPGNKTVY